uniref:NIPA-like protein 2 isoform X2 n=1 Tax=Styela clava TaxID=7725 RepID=UPI00193A21FF|nr:NIPA-like protein 2 isoform X2 [Styela clava]
MRLLAHKQFLLNNEHEIATLAANVMNSTAYSTGNDSTYGNYSLFNDTSNHTTNITNEEIVQSKRQAIGVALAVSGNIMISLALSVQKYAHNRLGDEGKYCLDKWWWLGMVMMGLGEFGNFMAYGYAPASLVAPLGSVAVLSNVFIAFIFLRETVTPHSIVGVSLVIIGSIFLISFSAFSQPQLDVPTIYEYLKAWSFLLYIGIEIVALGILFYLYFYKNVEHLLILLLFVAIFASVTVISAKAVSTLLSETIRSGVKYIANPVFWIMLFLLPVTTAIQIRFLNRAMQLYNVSDVVPVNFIFFTVSAILAGSIFYQEFYGVPFLRVFMFLFGCLLSFIGVYIISHKGKTLPKCSCWCGKEEDTANIIENKDKDDDTQLSDIEIEDENDLKIPESAETSSSNNHGDFRLIARLANFLKQTETISRVQPKTND